MLAARETKMDDLRKRQFQISGGFWLLAFAALLMLQGLLLREAAPRRVAYSELLKSLRDGRLAAVELREAEIVAELTGGDDRRRERIVATRLPGIDESPLLKELEERGVGFSGRIERTS
jgi:hypothetical protein